MTRSASTRIISLAAAIIILIPSLFSCSKKYDYPESTEEESRTVITVGDNEVPFELYRYFFMNYKHDEDHGIEAYWNGADKDAEFKRLDKKTREALRRIYATLDLALEYDIDYKSGKIQKAALDKINDQIENDFGGVDGYSESLGTSFLTHSVYKFMLAEFECEDQLYAALVDNGTIKNDDEALSKALSDGAFCRAKQILIKNDPGDDPVENRALAEQLLMQVQMGDDFDALVAKYGEDPEMITSPVGYYFTHGQLIEEFEDAAFALDIGECSDIVESDIGYHIILRCELDPAYVSANRDSLATAFATSQYYAEVSKNLSKFPVKDTDLSRSLTFDDFLYTDNK